MELSLEEASLILQITDRVQISGKEARAVAYIQGKLEAFVKEQPAPEVKEKKK